MMHALGKCCSVHGVAYVLVLVGALNWGLKGVGDLMDMDLNLVHMALGMWPMVESIVYVVVGLSAVAMCFQSACARCKE